ncbi:MAG: hypothetical protein JST08_11645 [Actinobacteria bacterium]|nr:hypothetical protein [Actinomycetota bacterium]
MEAFDFLDAVSATLGVAIDRAAQLMAAAPEPSIQKTAVLVATIRAFRAIRAASAVISCGYAMEAEPYIRTLLELYVSARAVADDPTGDEARAWLEGGRARGIGRRVRESMPDTTVYGLLSQASHGDPRALVRSLRRVSEGQQTIEWGPARSDETDERFHHLAIGARDFVVLLEEVGFGPHPELDAIDQALERVQPGWRPDAVYSS